MSSPNEPGYSRAGDRPANSNGGLNGSGSAGNGSNGSSPSKPNGSTPNSHNRENPDSSSTPRTAAGPSSSGLGHVTDPGDVPPWQRGPAARANQQGQSAPHPPEQSNHADNSQPVSGASPGTEERINRFLAGSSSTHPHEAEPAAARPRSERTDVGRAETYGSELPDLSGPVPRPPQRKAVAPERPASTESASRANAPTSRIQVGNNRARGPVRASMQIRRIDPWSTLKISLVLAVVLFFVWMIAVALLYLVLGGMGVWSKLNTNVGDLLNQAGGTASGELVSSGTIFGGAALIGLVNIVILTAMATVGAFIYNLTTDLVGGVEVTLADRD